jgi:type II secretory pathway component PulF
MPVYLYRAKQGPRKTVDGEISADSQAAALAQIDAKGFSPVWVREKDIEDAEFHHSSGRGISQRDVNIFTRQLASLIKAGVSILRSLRTIRDQTANRHLKRVVTAVEESIRDGNMLSESLMRYPRLFSQLYVNMVRSGESAGILDKILVRLADAREKEEETRKKVQSALAYPLLMLAMGILTVSVMLGFLLPRITHLFKNEENLPWATRILVNVSNGFADHWYVGMLLIVLAVAIVRRIGATVRGAHVLDSITLRIPLIGAFVRQVNIARFSRTMSLLVETGIPVDRGLGLSAATMNNAILRDEIEKVREEAVQQGTQIASALKRSKNFPLFVVNMIAVGEETGSLEDALAEVATFYEREVDLHTRMMTTLLEPLLILVMGVVVGFIVFAMLLPIFEIGNVIG